MKKKRKTNGLTDDQLRLFAIALKQVEDLDSKIFHLVSAMAAVRKAEPLTHRYARIMEIGDQLGRARNDRLEAMHRAMEFTPHASDVECIVLVRRVMRLEENIFARGKYRKKSNRVKRAKVMHHLINLVT